MARYDDRSHPEWPPMGEGEPLPQHGGAPWNLGPGEIITPQRKRRPIWPWLVLLAVLLVCGISIPILAASGDGGPTSGGQKGIPATTPAPPRKAQPPAKKKPSDSPTMASGNGHYKAGKGLMATGVYRSPGKREDAVVCYYHTALSTGDDKIVDQGVIAEVDQPALVTVKAGQWFRTSGCQDWTLQKD